MKTFLLLLVMASAISFQTCKNSNRDKENTANNQDSATKTSDNNTAKTPDSSASVGGVISTYLELKNALVADNGKEAADAGDKMRATLSKVDESGLPDPAKKAYAKVKDDMIEHAEHIGGNASNIEHQREHFDMLSQDIISLVGTTGSAIVLYRDFCPMYNENKGASWLSETKEIKNPYFGKKMPKCGEIKEEIKAKE